MERGSAGRSARERKKRRERGSFRGVSGMHVANSVFSPLLLLSISLFLSRMVRAARFCRNYHDIEESRVGVRVCPGLDYFIILSENGISSSGSGGVRGFASVRTFGRLRTVKSMRYIPKFTIPYWFKVAATSLFFLSRSSSGDDFYFALVYQKEREREKTNVIY